VTLHLRNSECQQANHVALHIAWFKGCSDIYCRELSPDSDGAEAHPGRFATFLPQVEMAFNTWPVILCRLPGIVKPIED
jgi:hypothetical protein